MRDIEAICNDCRRTNYRNACTGVGHHCPLAVVEHLMEREEGYNATE